jgi:hypothetical protein
MAPTPNPFTVTSDGNGGVFITEKNIGTRWQLGNDYVRQLVRELDRARVAAEKAMMARESQQRERR